MYKVLICTPCFGSMCYLDYMTCLISTRDYLLNKGVEVRLSFIGYESLIPRARNTFVARFMALKDYTHMFFIDADLIWNPEDVYNLLLEDKDLIGGIYPKKKYRWDRLNIVNSEKDVSKLLDYNINYKNTGVNNGLIEVKNIATGFMMIKKNVISKLIEYYGSNKKYVDDIESCTKAEKEFLYSFFDCEIVNGHYLSEDYYFCHLWSKIGGKIYANLKIQLTHIGKENYNGNILNTLSIDYNNTNDKKTSII